MVTGRIPATGEIIHTAAPLGTRLPNVQKIFFYVNHISNDGWLLVNSDAGHLSLCKYTKLLQLYVKSGRTFLRVMEGSHHGKTVSLTNQNAATYLGKVAPVQSDAKLSVVYNKYVEKWYSKARKDFQNQQMATLTIGNITAQITMNSIWGMQYYPLPPDTYSILIPDSPHTKDFTRFYRDAEPSLIYDQVWFPINFADKSRYVHVGNVSEGCVTVLDLALWPKIHEALISHRSPDGKSVGQLIVSGKPERDR